MPTTRREAETPAHCVQEALALDGLDHVPRSAPPDGTQEGASARGSADALLPKLRPRERLPGSGPEALTSVELLALILGAENPRTLALAGEMVSGTGGLAGLRRASVYDLLGVAGVGLAKACAISAAVELGKRLVAARGDERHKVCSPRDAEALLGGRLRDLDREHFVCVLLDTKHRVISAPTISVGTLSASLVHPREVFKPAIRASAHALVLAHNHPSGHTGPSPEDRPRSGPQSRALRLALAYTVGPRPGPASWGYPTSSSQRTSSPSTSRL